MEADKDAPDLTHNLFHNMELDGVQFSQIRAYTGDVLYTEKMSGTQIYMIKQGQVDLYLMREERRVVVESLKKGESFGMNASVLDKGRATNAAAATYTELYVIDSTTLENYLHNTPAPIRAILGTLAGRMGRLSELVASRVNYQPDLLVYAQLLQIMGMAEMGGRPTDARASADKKVAANVSLVDVFGHGSAILGHSDPHIRHVFNKLLSLHLVRVEDVNGNGKRVFFSPKDIVLQARKLADTDKDIGKVDHEYVTVDEFSAMVGVDRSTLLTKLARSEFSQDIFTFRKSEIIQLLDTKGKKFFSDRKIKSPNEFVDIDDIEFADQKSILAVLSRFESFDLAKLIAKMDEGKAKEKILASLPRAKREEVEDDLKSVGEPDAVEVIQIGQMIISKVKAVMLGSD